VWIFQTQLAIKWPFSFSPPHCLLLHYLGNADQAKYALKYTQKREQNILDIIDHNLKKHHQILIISGVNIFNSTVYTEWLFKFPPHPTSSLALPGENRPSKSCVKMNKKNFNEFYQSRSLALNSQLIERSDCHKAGCLPNDVQKCLWIQELTGKVCILVWSRTLSMCQ